MALHFRLPSTGGQKREGARQGRIDFHFPKLHLTSPPSAAGFDCMQFSRCRRRSLLQQASPPDITDGKKGERGRRSLHSAWRSEVGLETFMGPITVAALCRSQAGSKGGRGGERAASPLMPSWRRLAG